MELLANLGIDWRLFIAQAINFVVLLVILQRFLFKPLIAMLDKRAARLKQGLELSDQMESRVQALEDERAKVVRDARVEAERIVSAALADAEKSRTELLEAARTDAKRIIEEGTMILSEQQRLSVQNARKEVAGLVVEATRKVLDELGPHELDVATLTKAAERLARA